MVHSVSGWTRSVQVKCEIAWERVPYLSALEVCSEQGAIQIHVYLTLPYLMKWRYLTRMRMLTVWVVPWWRGTGTRRATVENNREFLCDVREYLRASSASSAARRKARTTVRADDVPALTSWTSCNSPLYHWINNAYDRYGNRAQILIYCLIHPRLCHKIILKQKLWYLVTCLRINLKTIGLSGNPNWATCRKTSKSRS